MLPLTVSALTVTAPNGRRLLDVPELALGAGGLLGVKGPSGAGKTTLLHALGGLLQPQGTVRWGDADLGTLTAETRARFRAEHMGMIFQDFLLFDELSPKENAGLSALFAPKAKRSAVRNAAVAQLSHLKVPTDVRSVASFSGGERQRVAVARALTNRPPVVLADEPTGNLDEHTADSVMDTLLQACANQQTALVLVTHNPTYAQRTQRSTSLHLGALE